jgi:NADP-dependent 3-hydroxy acid dehydrogenase YdfG
VRSELVSHNAPEVQAQLTAGATYEWLSTQDQAEAIVYAVTLPRHAFVADLWFMPTEQV